MFHSSKYFTREFILLYASIPVATQQRESVRAQQAGPPLTVPCLVPIHGTAMTARNSVRATERELPDVIQLQENATVCRVTMETSKG